MSETRKLFNFDLNFIINVSEKLKTEIGEITDFEYQQFFLDVVSKNYKVEPQTYLKFISYGILLVLPIEEIIKLVLGRAAIIYDLVNLPIDEVYLIVSLAELSKNEFDKYLEFTNSKKYSPATVKDLKKVFKKDKQDKEIKAELWTVVKEVASGTDTNATESGSYQLVTSEINKTNQIAEIVEYKPDNYRQLICEYIANNSDQDGYAKLNYKKIAKQLAFADYFDGELCRRIVQNEMKSYISAHSSELDTYKLTEEYISQAGYFKIKSTDDKVIRMGQTSEVRNDSKIVSINRDLSLELFVMLTNEIQICAKEEVNTLIIITKDIVVEMNKRNNMSIDVISTAVENLEIARNFERELENFGSALGLRKITDIIAVKGDAALTISNSVDIQVNSAVERVVPFIEGEEVEIEVKRLKYLIPMYEKQNINKYLKSLEHNPRCSMVDVSNGMIILNREGSNEFKQMMLNAKRDMSFDDMMLTIRIDGSFDANHICKILNAVFYLQSSVESTSFISLVCHIWCGNGVLLSAEINSSKIQVKIFDTENMLGTKREIELEKILKSEIESSSKFIAHYS